MILHPNIQENAQIEIDRVVGRSRSPTFADMVHLPYVRAIVKEVRPKIVQQDGDNVLTYSMSFRF